MARIFKKKKTGMPRSRTSFTTGLRPNNSDKEAISNFLNNNITRKKFLLRGLILVLGITCLFGYFLFENFGAQAQEQIKIFPTVFSEETNWQNPQAVFSQDLGENAVFEEFNTENSVYPLPAEAGNSKSEILNSKQIANLKFQISNISKILNSKFQILTSKFFARAEEPSPTPTPEATPTPTPTLTPTPTPAPTPTPEPTPTSTPTPTPESTPTLTPSPTLESSSTPTPKPTSTSEPTSTPTPTPTIEPTPTPTSEATPKPSPEATPTPEPTFTDEPTPTETSTLEPTPEITPEPMSTETPTPTPEPRTPPEADLGGQATPTPTPTPEPESPLDSKHLTGQAIKKVLELSNFSLSTDFSENKIENVQLRMSLAGKGRVGDKLTIDYYFKNTWQNLAEFNLEDEISNAKNGGYFLYALPIFENWEDLGNLKIRFTYQGVRAEIYLDAVWLEINYEEERPEIEEVIREQPQIKDWQKIRMPTKFHTFLLSDNPIKTKRWLDWHPKNFRIKREQENKEINVKILGQENQKIVFKGACQKDYFVILIYRRAEDYEENPSLFIYNKAFPCKNGTYYYELTDLSSSLLEGTYYFLVAEEGKTGPWYPITALQPIQITTIYK